MRVRSRSEETGARIAAASFSPPQDVFFRLLRLIGALQSGFGVGAVRIQSQRRLESVDGGLVIACIHLAIAARDQLADARQSPCVRTFGNHHTFLPGWRRSEEHTSELQSRF